MRHKKISRESHLDNSGLIGDRNIFQEKVIKRSKHKIRYEKELPQCHLNNFSSRKKTSA